MPGFFFDSHLKALQKSCVYINCKFQNENVYSCIVVTKRLKECVVSYGYTSCVYTSDLDLVLLLSAQLPVGFATISFPFTVELVLKNFSSALSCKTGFLQTQFAHLHVIHT